MGVVDLVRIFRTSKTGVQYQMLCITFENGYTMEVFLNNEQVYILKDIPLAD